MNKLAVTYLRCKKETKIKLQNRLASFL